VRPDNWLLKEAREKEKVDADRERRPGLNCASSLLGVMLSLGDPFFGPPFSLSSSEALRKGRARFSVIDPTACCPPRALMPDVLSIELFELGVRLLARLIVSD